MSEPDAKQMKCRDCGGPIDLTPLGECNRCLDWQDRAIEAGIQRDAALAALKKYGRHTGDCHAGYFDGHLKGLRCTCGLDAALKEDVE